MVEKKIIITGASGLLGRIVYKYLSDNSFQAKYPLNSNETYISDLKWNCLGLCFSRAKENLRSIDLTNFDEVDKLIDDFKPDAIVHCAAERKVEAVESDFEKCLQLNSAATEHLAQISAQKGIKFVYISTDYVFDGKNPPYKISDPTNPINKYGMSKMYGEQVTQKASKEHFIVRVPVLYGFTEPNKLNESAVNILYEKVAKVNEKFLVDDVQVRYPTHTIDIARFIAQLLRKYFQSKETRPIEGVFQCCAPDSYTKYAMSCVMADLFNITKTHIQPDYSALNVSSNRPDNCQMDTSYSFDLIDFKTIMKFDESIKECLETFFQ